MNYIPIIAWAIAGAAVILWFIAEVRNAPVVEDES